MANEDLRVQRTRKLLKDAFRELFVRQDFEKITIRGLCEKAMVNRRTFYLHYSSLEDILEEILGEYTKDYYEHIKSYDPIEDVDELVRIYFTYSEEHSEIFEKINTHPKFEYIRLRMVQKVQDYATDDNNFAKLHKFDRTTQNLIHSYINWSCVGVYREWVKSGRSLPMERVIRIAANLIKNGLTHTVRESHL